MQASGWMDVMKHLELNQQNMDSFDDSEESECRATTAPHRIEFTNDDAMYSMKETNRT